jgi:hypothetical protein
MKITYSGYRNGFAVSVELDSLMPSSVKEATVHLDKVETFLASIGIEVVTNARLTDKASEKVVQPLKGVTAIDDDLLYTEDGTPICPRHNKPMVDGPFGPYCRTKCSDGEPASHKNTKGYCNYKPK